MNVEQKMVKEFHEKFGFTINDVPTLIDSELFKIRYDNTISELEELKAAYAEGDLSKIADAIVDLIYFLKGTGVAFGIDLEPVFDEIHRSNMTKDRPENGGDKKAVKGPNYSPPNIAPIIAKMNDAIPEGKALFCSCGIFWTFSRLDAVAHARYEGHKLKLIDAIYHIGPSGIATPILHKLFRLDKPGVYDLSEKKEKPT